MADKKTENKVLIEREYIIPIKKYLRHTPDYKKARKAVKIVLEFVAKHLRVEDRDTKNVRMDKLVNNELWWRGIANPPNKIKVKVKKFSDGIAHVELFEIPKVLQYRIDRDKKQGEKIQKEAKSIAKKEETHDHSHEGHDHSHQDSEEKKVEAKEKQASTVQAGLTKQATEARQAKHTTSEKPIKRQTPVQKNIPKNK